MYRFFRLQISSCQRNRYYLQIHHPYKSNFHEQFLFLLYLLKRCKKDSVRLQQLIPHRIRKQFSLLRISVYLVSMNCCSDIHLLLLHRQQGSPSPHKPHSSDQRMHSEDPLNHNMPIPQNRIFRWPGYHFPVHY